MTNLWSYFIISGTLYDFWYIFFSERKGSKLDNNDNKNNSLGISKPESMQHSISQRYFKYNSQLKNEQSHQRYANIVKKNKLRLESDYFKAIKFLKKDIIENTFVYQRNILVNEDGKYRLLSYKDFLTCDSDLRENEKIRNRLYVDIRDYLRALERETKINEKHNKILYTQSDVDTYYFDYTIKEKIPDRAIKFLYEISLGDFRIVRALARYCAQIVIKPKKNIIPTVILADKSIHKPLIDFFIRITSGLTVDIDLSKMTNVSEVSGLAYANWNNSARLALAVESEIPELESKVEVLRKIMRGQNLSIKHPYFTGKIFVNNQIPFLYITESHEKYLKMKNIYGAKTIKIQAKYISPLIISSAFDNWFKNDFVKLGAKWYSGEARARVVTPKITDDDIFESFSNDMCTFDEGLDCSTNELYIAYTEYYKRFYGESPLSFRKFRTQFAIVKNLDTCRPHHSNKSNPRCFKGIGIDYDKYTELLEKGGNTAIKCTKKDFAYHLLEMIRKEFPEIDY